MRVYPFTQSFTSAALAASLLFVATSPRDLRAADDEKKPAAASAAELQARVKLLTDVLAERETRARAIATDLMRYYEEVPNAGESVKKVEDSISRMKAELAKASEVLIKADAATKELRARADDAKLGAVEGEIILASSDLKRAVDRFGWSARMVKKGYVSPLQNSSDRAGVTKAADKVSQTAVKWRDALGPVSPVEMRTQLEQHFKARKAVESLSQSVATLENQRARLRSNHETRGLIDDERRGLKRLAAAERSRREATAILADLSSHRGSPNATALEKLKTAEALVREISADIDRAAVFSDLARDARQVLEKGEIMRKAERVAAEIGLD